MKRTASLIIAATALGAWTAPAQADFLDNVFRGLDLIATPLGPVELAPGGGLVNGGRLGRVRVVPNQAGGGHRLEFDRFFGLDSRNRPEVLDLGPLELELSGQISTTASYTTRLLPTASIDTSIVGLQYSLRNDIGLNPFEISGTLDLVNTIEVDRLGNYTFNLAASNANASITADGLLVGADEDINFDIGPISISGNVFVDGTLALLTSFGVDTSSLEALFPASPIDRINTAIRAQLQDEMDLVAGLQVAADAGLVGPKPVLKGRSDQYLGTPVPEPTSLALLALGGLALLRRR